MEIYILRHAIAAKRNKKKYPNDDRPLTEQGIAKMKLAAVGIRNVLGSVDVIISSPLARTRQTATIAAKALKYKHKIVIRKELLPDQPVSDIIAFLSKLKKSARVMLVGHESSLGRMVSALLGSEHVILQIRKGGICRVDVGIDFPKEPGTLVWHLTPRQLRQLGQS